jgi:hypothetical protein
VGVAAAAAACPRALLSAANDAAATSDMVLIRDPASMCAFPGAILLEFYSQTQFHAMSVSSQTIRYCTLLLLPLPLTAQSGPDVRVELGAQAIPVVTRESPAVHGTALTEGYLSQPVVMAQLGLWKDALTLRSTLDFEGVTLKRGELNAGIVGEGYIDRRHPHTYLHELVATAQKHFGEVAASLSAGKGFAPFGTDDPMSRPFEKYPINHHLAQILERAVAIAALRGKSVMLEGGLFNGDEPQDPGDTPNRKRYWDSWSGRVTALPFSQAEVQASYARVKSPELAAGGGFDQRKQSASIRLEDKQHSGYALFEWARTGDYVGSEHTLTYTSVLAETWARYGLVNGALRFERTDRPDEERLLDPFRTPVPATDLSIAGRSRWTIITTRVAATVSTARVDFAPFTEVARIFVSETLKPSGFDPRAFYGSDGIWSVSAGAKISFGMNHMRMGRYGSAVPPQSTMKMDREKMPGMNMASVSNASLFTK